MSLFRASKEGSDRREDEELTGVSRIFNAATSRIQLTCSRPTLIPKLLGIRLVAVSCGAGHSVALSDAGVAFSWGMGQSGQVRLCRYRYCYSNFIEIN